MTTTPSFDDIFAVMGGASHGDDVTRVSVPQRTKTGDLATRLAIALNLLLDDLSSRARAAEQMADRLRVLADVAHEFSEATPDPEQLLSTVARRLADTTHDLCVVRLISDDGTLLVPVALHAVEADAEQSLREAYADPMPLSSSLLARRVHETGEPVLVAEIDIEADRPTITPKVYEWARRIGLHSLMILPLRSRGTSIGQLFLARHRSQSPSFDEHDLNFARALATHASVAIANSRSYAAERRARALAEKAIDEARASEARYRLIFDNTPLPKWLYDAHTLRFLDVNATAVREYGYSREDLLAMTVLDMRVPEDADLVPAAITTGATTKAHTLRLRKKGGDVVTVEMTSHAFALGDRACRLAVARDVTEQLQLEAQLRQSQKMEAIGRLAGGVAHDFNNILSVILSYGGTLLEDLKPGEPARADVAQMCKAGERAAALTRQLLMFSRQQVVEPKVLDLNDVLLGMDRMLRRLVGDDIELALISPLTSGRVCVDPGSMEQVIMNLVVNARDAMAAGGKLTMETANVVLDADYARTHHGVAPGPYVMLAVSDTGTGIDGAELERIFEPFFTTKATGKGTGLGLSTVLGIAQQAGGSVWVDSEPGKGATFRVFLPRVDDEVEVARAASAPTRVSGSETILLVEDDDQVRAVARGMLRRSGYQVLEARNPGEALLHAEEHGATIHLLLTDVVMPQMSGPQLAKRLARIRPEMKVLCMSGYTEEGAVRDGLIESRVAFIQKPVTPETLTKKVREVLDSAK